MPFKKPEEINPEAHKIALQMAEAAEKELNGWNLCCNVCGIFGAEWIANARPGWGSLALCPEHKKSWEDEQERHRLFLTSFKVAFEQPSCARDASNMVLNSSWCKRHRKKMAGIV